MDDENQYAVAHAMNEWAATNDPEFVVTTGDNFYSDGAVSPTDPRFNTTWRDVYNGEHIRYLDWYISLGNHDHHDRNGQNMVDYEDPEGRWILPDFYYSFYKETPDGATIHFIVIDTDPLTIFGSLLPQYDWLEEELASSEADWRIVIGHHPAYTAGGHAPGDFIIRRSVVPLMKENAVDIYLVGHSHNMQHIVNATDPEGDIDHVVCGGGGRGLRGLDEEGYDQVLRMGMEVPYFEATHGFTELDFSLDSIIVNHYSVESPSGEFYNSYSFTRTKGM